MNLKIESSNIDETSVQLVLIGELDIQTSKLVRDAVDSSIGDGHIHMTVDMSGIEYIDSTGLGVLINALKAADEKGGAFQIVAPSRRVLRLFELTGTTALFKIPDTSSDSEGEKATTQL